MAAVMMLLVSKACIAQSENTDAAANIIQPKTPKITLKDSAQIRDSIYKRGIRKATIHSAIFPGWGQINNKQYWKLPIVYAAVGIPAYLFFYNLEQYRVVRQAYIYRLDDDPTNDDLIPDNLKPLSDNSIRFYRDEFRRNVDYSVLAFILAWGLNVVDANVSAHLRGFDVSDNLSLRLKPSVMPNLRGASMGLALTPKATAGTKAIVLQYTSR